MRLAVPGVALALTLAACTPQAGPSSTAGPSTTTVQATTTTAEPLDQSLGPVAEPVRHPAVARPIYFVMPDRFANGDPSNDTGGIEGGPLEHGFLPENRAFHHGGDLAGLTEKLPYLADLGIGAIWITPPFTNNFVQGNGTIEGSSSSYHGYWQIDWTRIDPHLGTEEEMLALIAAAHDLGLHVYFDVVLNHTGDVIRFAEDRYVYSSQSASPFLTADGEPFDPSNLGDEPFPELDPEVSFPYTPTFEDPADATIKAPDWLNDVTLYHNRGNSTFQGESSLYGDFFGLDDLFTEHPRVREGLTELHADIIRRYGIDGFRVDTMKHVDSAFWEYFAPRIRQAAAEAGRPDFFFFGEVFNTDPITQSAYVNLGVPATLDFILAAGLERYVAQGASADALEQAFDQDDWFTDTDGNAYQQVTFFGNHDMGRMGLQIDNANPAADDQGLLARMQLGFDLLFMARGVPTVYYGDEQGFVGDGGDQLARQDMFPSVTPEYVDDDNIGTDATPADDNFDQTHPLYLWVSDLAALRSANPTLQTGAQIIHLAEGPLFAFSRIDRVDRVEHVVVANNSTLTVPARFRVQTPGTTFTALRPETAGSVTSDANGELVVEVPPLSTVVLVAETAVPIPEAEPEVTLVRPSGQEIPTFRYRVEAELADRRYAEVTFSVAVDGGEPVAIGTDDNPPYRVYWDNTDVADGAVVDIIATVDDGSGRLRSYVKQVTMGVRR
jgi:glycosidase